MLGKIRVDLDVLNQRSKIQTRSWAVIGFLREDQAWAYLCRETYSKQSTPKFRAGRPLPSRRCILWGFHQYWRPST